VGQTHIRNLPHVPIPSLTEVIHLYETVAKAGGAFKEVKIKGIALNTFHLDEKEAQTAIKEVALETGLPCTDVVRYGADDFLESIISFS
jgi:uncharacterized NAD-dependent epimerase/dehydratase family protein